MRTRQIASTAARNECLDGKLNHDNTTTVTHNAVDDAELALSVRIRAGDRGAWEQIYDRYSHDLWRYVARLLGNSSETVTEVVQEVFLAAAKGARTFDPERGTWWSWLTGIAHRQVAEHYRRQARIQRGTQLAIKHHSTRLNERMTCSSNPVELLEQKEMADIVRSLLCELSEEYAALLAAKYMDLSSVEEIRRRFGGTSDSIRSKLRRARAEFRTAFERLNGGGEKSA